MKLYHETNLCSAFNICVNGINLSCSEKYLDFGVGFYTTDSEWKAKKEHDKRLMNLIVETKLMNQRLLQS